MTDKDVSENKLIAERRSKLRELRTEGFGFPNEYRRTALAGQLHHIYDDYSNETLEKDAIEVEVGGRLMTKRVMGKASFATIQDRSGKLQLCVFAPHIRRALPSTASSLSPGFCAATDHSDIAQQYWLVHALCVPQTRSY